MYAKTVTISIATLLVGACASTPNETALSAAQKAERRAAMAAEHRELTDYRYRQWEKTSIAQDDVKMTDAQAERRQASNPQAD